MGSRLSYFEVTSTDMERAQSFYREMFGWQVMALPEMGGYAVVDTQSGEGGASGGIGPVMDGGAGGIRPRLAVDVGGVEEGDPGVEGVLKGVPGLVVSGAAVDVAERHAPESDG